MERRLIETADGSKTLFIPEMNEQYHSVNGALTESEYVFLQNGYLAHSSQNTAVFEVGFGTGLNALITAVAANQMKRKTRYVTIEKYPVTVAELELLNYGEQISEAAEELFDLIHKAEWEADVQISEFFVLKKIQADLTKFNIPVNEKFDVIFFDAFGPDKQPQMWQYDIFLKIYESCNRGGIFVTYSAKGEIRRQLAACGFEMERLPGPPGKRQMLRGSRI